MHYFGTAQTDVGISKTINQDSICLKIAATGRGEVAFAAVCDGLGGLAKGELASATLLLKLEGWFCKELPALLGAASKKKVSSLALLQQTAPRLEALIQEEHRRMQRFFAIGGAQIGTTLSMMLLFGEAYLIMHIGDSRIYALDGRLQQLTKDQTFVEREVCAGRMTRQQAAMDHRRNVLLQCVGSGGKVQPVVSFGRVRPETVFLLCSDGFTHVLSKEELYASLCPKVLSDAEKMAQQTKRLIGVAKQRRETDNISVVLVKATA